MIPTFTSLLPQLDVKMMGHGPLAPRMVQFKCPPGFPNNSHAMGKAIDVARDLEPRKTGVEGNSEMGVIWQMMNRYVIILQEIRIYVLIEFN
jgi:hypothetical protein